MNLESNVVLPQAIALDLDGTLLNSQQQISERTLAALQAFKRSGRSVIIATGRPLRLVRAILRQLESVVDYVICYNGAYVGDCRTSWSAFYPIDHELAAYVQRRVLDDHPDGLIIWETETEWYANREPRESERLHFLISEPRPQLLDARSVKRLQPAKLLIPNRYFATELTQTLGGLLNVMELSSSPFVEISEKAVSKARGILTALARMQVPADGIAVFGDDYNDVSMFETFPHSYAMANADPAIRQLAREVTLSNDENGVAVKLEEWLS